MRYLIAMVLIIAALWGGVFLLADSWPRVGDFILLRSDARPAFYEAHPELSTEIIFSGGGILIYRVLSED